MDVSQIEAAITSRTKAILPVHLYGQPADMDPVVEIARRHRLGVVEDAAQAHGAEYKGRRVGCLGDLGCFSFYPGKNLGAYGEGGIVVTNRPDYMEMARMLRDWGQKEKYQHTLRGYNYRMDNLQGCILRVKLRHLDSWTEARRANADLYKRALSNSEVTIPIEMPYSRHVYHLYVVRSAERDALQRFLYRRVRTGIHYPIPVHLQPAYADLDYYPGDFPCSEKTAQEVLSLPMYPELQEPTQRYIAQCIANNENGGAKCHW
jgi:dTDP-4-amino-4,6-dideoxygalactose transaminase